MEIPLALSRIQRVNSHKVTTCHCEAMKRKRNRRGNPVDCFVATLLAMTTVKHTVPVLVTQQFLLLGAKPHPEIIVVDKHSCLFQDQHALGVF